MNGGPSGFNNAPVTRAFVIACALFTIFFGIQGGSSKLGFSYEDIFRKLRLWKFVLSVFAFSSTPELMFGLYLIYYFRVFERQIGSNKYSVFILFSVVVSLLSGVIALSVCKGWFHHIPISYGFQLQKNVDSVPTANILKSGPYGVIFASFVPFFFDIPVSTWFHVFGVRFSDKSFIYLAGLQLLLSSWKRSLLSGVCGFFAGSMYRLNLFGIRKAKFPEFIVSSFSFLSWPSLGSPGGNSPGSAPSSAGHIMERTTHPAPTAPVEPPEDYIVTLVSMGFDRNSARQALMLVGNDINVATNILLEAQSQ